MQTTTKKIINSLVVLSIFLLMAQIALIHGAPAAEAGNLWDMQKQSDFQDEIGKEAFQVIDPDKPEDIRVIVAGVIRALLGALGIVFVFLLVIAGYKWMTAAGNEEKVTEAMSQIKMAIIGLIIVLAAWSITTFIGNCLVDVTGVSSYKWYCP